MDVVGSCQRDDAASLRATKRISSRMHQFLDRSLLFLRVLRDCFWVTGGAGGPFSGDVEGDGLRARALYLRYRE